MAASTKWDRIWLGGHLATMRGGGDLLGEIHNGAIACMDGRISWVGEEEDLPGRPEELARDVVDVDGCWITPGLVDCHTHMVFAGDRSREFEARLHGATYEEIARKGGGIRTTMYATREASEEDLFRVSGRRLRVLMAEGVTTVEIKSGYGMETGTELRMLKTARRLGETHPVDVQTSFLGAHVVPPEFDGRRGAYVDLLCKEMIPKAVEAKLADSVDAFCDEIAFTFDECRAVLRAALELGLPVRLHADQLSDQGGASLAANLGARSADHLERTSIGGVNDMAAAGTVAVLLPGAFYFLQDNQPPPVASFREAGVPMALGTDLNPGSSPLNSLLTALNLACVLFRLTPEEALMGVTCNGARALGLHGTKGSLEIGKTADLAIWEIGHPRELSYWVGKNPCVGVVKDGESTLSFSAPGPPDLRG
ncbi:MAG: imidazolonepropionase [Gemmatimonadetes bacterium]|nr:imidazolonepropionase [Gemmatimonadota bacterium]NNM32628.1 imidazolonepropionase [Gemmatimonadota bacterium]